MLFSSYMDSDNATHYKKRSDVIASDYKDQKQDISQNSPSDLSDLSEASNEGKKRLFIIGAVTFGVVALIVVGLFLTQRKNVTGPTPTPEPTSTPAPTVTPKPSFDRSEWSLEVLNGTGVTGAAKKLADKLVELGYKIVKTGNADRSDYEASQLFVAKDMKDKQDLLLEDLKKEISIASVSGELKDSTASARIIVGKE